MDGRGKARQGRVIGVVEESSKLTNKNRVCSQVTVE